MSGRLERYELFGWDYEHFNPLTAREVAWYQQFAEKCGGPVLELACGTGRLLALLAEAGLEVTGLDLSEAMLAQARQRVEALPADIRGRVRLEKADMCDFDLGRKFATAIIADNSFRELDNENEYGACLDCVGRHLRPGGALLVTVRRFDPGSFRDGVRRWGPSAPLRNPKTGEQVTRRVEVRLEDNGRILRGKMIYKTIAPDGRQRTDVCTFEAPVMNTDDYLRLFRQAGFDPELYVGYEATKDDGREPMLCFVCQKGK